MARFFPVAASQILPVSSPLAVTTNEPSGLIAQALTGFVWPTRLARSVPVAASQILPVRSALAVTTNEPSGLIAQALTGPS